MHNGHLPAVTMLEHVMTSSDPLELKSILPETLNNLTAIQLYTLIHMEKQGVLSQVYFVQGWS